MYNDDEVEMGLFEHDALVALVSENTALKEDLRIARLQGREWQGQCAALKREVKALRKMLEKGQPS